MPAKLDSRPIRLAAMSHDASHYLLTPVAVATPSTVDEVVALMAEASSSGTTITFRSGGTSLSGQSVTDGLLVDTRAGFRNIEVLDSAGDFVRVEPGATVRQVNARLTRFGRRLGPDPASEIACTVGGVIANNSSGMACGVEHNTYQTLESMRVVLHSGTTIDTEDPNSDDQLRALEPIIWHGLSRLRDRLRADPESVTTIRRLFAIKNTMGYGLNAFLDHERPVDLLTRLMIGSEGTLGWVASAVFRTVPAAANVSTGLLVLPSLAAATGALPALVRCGPATIELLDSTALKVAQTLDDVPESIASLNVERHAALLIEVQAEDPTQAQAMRHAISEVAASLPAAAEFYFSSDPLERASLWRVRKGLYPAIAGARPSGTTALLEDVAVPVENLLATCQSLVQLFERFGYDDAVIFGHAKDGNIHFLLTERFDSPEGVQRYAAVTEEIVSIVLNNGGTLKAEHGTGRVMAPFLERQYGAELTSIMREIKRLFDPGDVLNRGVIITADPEAHLRHLKTALTVEEEVDRCVECGYCEPTCPSKTITLTPRQRIVVRREIAAAEARGDQKLAAKLASEETYESVQTCAVDGLCAQACPVAINTGDLVRRLRADATSISRSPWNLASRSWSTTTAIAGAALTAAGAMPGSVARSASIVARSVLGNETVPLYDSGLPRGGRRRSSLVKASASVVSGDIRAGHKGQSESPTPPTADAIFLPACVGAIFGPDRMAEPTGLGATAAFLLLCERAGIRLAVPDEVDTLCCGTPWKSKGHHEGAQRMLSRVSESISRLDRITAGRLAVLPVISDAASCTEGFATSIGSGRVVDAVIFAELELLPRLTLHRRIERTVVHPTCSTEALGATESMVAIAKWISREAVVPAGWGCCAFAGDRGMLHPELTASASLEEANEVKKLAESGGPFTAAVSANRTCELGMSRATGLPYRHILELLEEATRPEGAQSLA